MAFDSYGAPQFGLEDVQIAVWNSTDSYGSAVDIPSVQLFGTEMQTVSAQLEGDDKITDSHAQIIGGAVRLRFGSVSMAALEVLLGLTSTASGSDQDHLKLSGSDDMPYFGICGKMSATQGSGDLHVFLPKVKIMENVMLAQAEYGQYIIPEVAAQAVDDTTYGVINLIEHAADTSITIPPTNL